MLKLLVKKQLMEIFRSYFYDAKKNTRRSVTSTIFWFALYLFLMVGVIGGMFTAFALMLCEPLVGAGMGWLYFALTGMIAIALGAFGSVFSTYSGLYLSKDNDLLLSLPIPVGIIIASRLASVYLVGLIYSAIVSIPSAIIYLINKFSIAALFGSIVNIFLISVFVAIISCLLGWVVAKISQKLKNKSFITVIISVVFLAAYYLVYFNAQQWLSQLVENAVLYGEKIKGKAYILYLLGKSSEGDPIGLLTAAAIVALLGALTWMLLSKSFISIATSTGSAAKVSGKLKESKQLSVSGTLLKSEFTHFVSSANYMLNCGLGVLMLPVAAVALFIKGDLVVNTLDNMFGVESGCTVILLCAAICMLTSMNDMAAPSVSLEGKSLWIKQSLPITGQQVLSAKFKLQFLMTIIPALICTLAVLIIVNANILDKLLMTVFIIIYITFTSAFGLYLGMRNPTFTWTNELMPIKQSMAVMISLFGGWAFTLIFGGLYFLVGYKLGTTLYLVISSAVFGLLAFLMLNHLFTKDAAKFAEL